MNSENSENKNLKIEKLKNKNLNGINSEGLSENLSSENSEKSNKGLKKGKKKLKNKPRKKLKLISEYKPTSLEDLDLGRKTLSHAQV